MRDLYHDLAESVTKGEEVALGLVIETSGSTPQKPGAKALFWTDGRSSGTLGGGCLEAEARKVALDCLRTHSKTLLRLHLDSDFGWDDGLICGGTARLFLDGAVDDQSAFWRGLSQFLKERKRGALITIVDSSDAAAVGSRYVVEVTDDSAKIAVPPASPSPLKTSILDFARRVVEERRPMTQSVSEESVTAEAFGEPLLPKPSLIIAGAGHIGAALCHLGSLLDFEVTVVDDRPSFANRERLPDATQIVVGDIAELVARQPLDRDTYIVIVTRGHRHDAQVLRRIIDKVERVAYIGMIGSKRKIKLIYDQLLEQGLVTVNQLRKVHSPLGIDIGGQSVWEIVLSIGAELVWVRNGCEGSLQPLHRAMWSLLRSPAPSGSQN